MKRLISAAAITMAAITPAMIQQNSPTTTVFIADGGRAYSGQPVQTSPRQPSSSSSSSSSSTSSPSQPAPTTNPVGAAVKAGSDLLGVFGR